MRRASRDDGLILAVAGVVALTFVVAELRVAGELGLPLDDSWIHLRFADNVAAGRGFAINPGVPVAGSTAPLWTLLLALAIAFGVPGLLAAKLLGEPALALLPERDHDEHRRRRLDAGRERRRGQSETARRSQRNLRFLLS